MSAEVINSGCPICGWDIDNLTSMCIKCWEVYSAEQYSLIPELNSSNRFEIDEVKEKVNNTLKPERKKHKSIYENYESYFINFMVWENKITSIGFKINHKWKEYRFKASFEYDISDITNTDLIKIDYISKLTIAEKASSWYKSFKSPNYFRFAWIKYKELREFIRRLLFEYHNGN